MPKTRLKQIAQDGATDGQVATWDNASGKWAPATPSGTSEASYGNLYMQGNATATAITVQSTYYKAAGTTTAGVLNGFTHTNNRLTYTGTATVKFLVTGGASVITDNNVRSIGIRLYKNGSAIAEYQRTSGDDVWSVNGYAGISTVVELATNDYLEVWITNYDSTASIYVGDLHLTAVEVNAQQGPAGATGAQGTAGADGDITWEGAWVTATSYTTNEAVTNGANSYVCILNHTSGASSEPGVGASWETYWEYYAKGFTLKGAWVTATAYEINDVAESNGSAYGCIADHTSGSTSEPGVGASWSTYWVLLTTSSVFGTQYQKAESLGISTTSSATFVQKLRLATSSLPSGNYIILWSYTIGPVGDNKQVLSQVQVDDTTTLSEQDQKIDGGAQALYNQSGHAILALDGVHNFDIDYAKGDGDAEISRARLTLWRVS